MWVRAVHSGEGQSSRTVNDALSQSYADEKRFQGELKLARHHLLRSVELPADDPLYDIHSGRKPLPLLSLEPWLEEASDAEKRALVAQWVERIEISHDKDAIARVKEERGITTDYEWRKVENKPQVKAEARTEVVLRKRGWPDLDPHMIARLCLPENLVKVESLTPDDLGMILHERPVKRAS